MDSWNYRMVGFSSLKILSELFWYYWFSSVLHCDSLDKGKEAT